MKLITLKTISYICSFIGGMGIGYAVVETTSANPNKDAVITALFVAVAGMFFTTLSNISRAGKLRSIINGTVYIGGQNKAEWCEENKDTDNKLGDFVNNSNGDDFVEKLEASQKILRLNKKISKLR